MTTAATSPALVHVLRLAPGEDLAGALDAYARAHQLEAAVILTCVGSLSTASLRFADRPETTQIEGKWEIVSLVGTLSASGGSHLHLAIADGQGATRGGHLMPGSKIYTTAEIALAELSALRFTREIDPTYGYHELVARPAAR